MLINNKDKIKKFGYKSFDIVRKKYNPNLIYGKFLKDYQILDLV